MHDADVEDRDEPAEGEGAAAKGGEPESESSQIGSDPEN